MTAKKNWRSVLLRKKKLQAPKNPDEHLDFGFHKRPVTLSDVVKERAVDRRSYRLKRPTESQMKDPTKDATLFDALKASYGKNSSIEAVKKKGYEYDVSLSSENVKVFYHPQNKKLLTAVAGSHNMHDFATDVYYFGGGDIKSTNRYKEAKKILEKAREKYHPTESVVTGHSLGGLVGRNIATVEDRVLTYNKFERPGARNARNELSIRHEWDWFSTFMKNDPNTKTVVINKGILDPYRAHEINALKKAPEFVV